MELRTGTLTRSQLQEEVSRIIGLLSVYGKQDLFVSYGWDCDLNVEELYQEKPLPLSELLGFLARSEKAGIFTLGENDLSISSADRSIEFTLCHESDIHMTINDAGLSHELQLSWTAKGYSWYEVPRRSEVAGGEGG